MFYCLLESLDDVESSGTNGQILKCDFTNLVKLFAIGVRKLPTGLGSDVIDTARIVRIEKSARQGLQHKIIFVVDLKKICDKLLWF